jgi:FkbH-like protein
MKNFLEVRKNLTKSFDGFKKISIAILADSATQFIAKSLKGYGYEYKIAFDIYETGYDQQEAQVFNPSSALYQFAPEYILILNSANKLYSRFIKKSLQEQKSFAKDYIQQITDQVQAINQKHNCKIIFSNFFEISDGLYGNYANKLEHSWITQVRNINHALMSLAREEKNLFINDILSLQNQFGTEKLTDPKLYVTSDIIFSLDGHAIVSKNITEIVSAIEGAQMKCLVLDLDNTLWGGIIGDDGIDKIQIGDLGIGKAFTEFQLWIKALKERGIILAVCSKNNEDIAKEVFENHPDMVLRLEDFAVFIANWNSKTENIKAIQKILNIGFDSMVFLDDNPVERAMVKEKVPGITVPDLPPDPALYLGYINSLNLFETASYSEMDNQRTRSYQDQVKRNLDMQYCTDETDFLKKLGMRSKVESFNKFNIPRVAQLSQRSNQFNLRTVRYTDFEIEKIAADPNYITLSFTLNDKYGENGLISIVILEKKNSTTLFIDSWIMSCRVLKRGMENFILNKIVSVATKEKFSTIEGQLIPTAKNGLVTDHYKTLGFSDKGNGYWTLDTALFKKLENFIEKE